jgi:transposase
MTRPYSLDLRDRVARFVVSGGTTREAADLFDVSVTAAGRWGRRLRETGSAAALAMGGVRQFYRREGITFKKKPARR